ncbi:hypothetical protein E2493_06395 [Sphingomonas parva]|uniref:Uncharacterized protein n=1 Tax=Sphingomonas parva TaxID=2555898 RepID=A0A4Y8ZT13_9SPHN|nr:hypothetical protein [Sphingomonas parva]TFI59151.1 hypothetical protein E2493_06395 [Sphingomonas parva]
MKTTRYLLLAACTAAGALSFGTAHGQQKAGTTATYWMSAETASGMGAMSAGGTRGMAAAMMGGRGPGYAHNLTLQLGTGQRPQGEPSAEHLPPAGLKAGASLPLVTPRSQPATGSVQPWQNMGKPKGRMLIYWGCGERARPGQPLIVDFAAMAAGKVPPAFANTVFKMMNPPSASSSTTYGEWPNDRSRTHVPAGGSLVGAHVVKGNYTPQIDFSLAPGQDFLAPVRLTSNAPGASGSVPLSWAAVPGSQAWLAATMGSGQNSDFVMWSSSETQAMAMASDYLAPEEIRRLTAAKVLMPATATSCTVPVEVARAAPQSMLMLTAFGGEANFSHPARPARAPASWRPDWTVKLRTKSTHSGLLGMSMDEMMGRDGGEREENAAPARPENTKSRLKRGLGKILGN